jgi:hypothetical protein
VPRADAFHPHTSGTRTVAAMRRFAQSHPLVTATLAGAAAGLAVAMLLLQVVDSPGGTLTRSNRIFTAAALPVRWWIGMVFGWVWHGSRTSEFLIILPLNGAAWATGLTALVHRVRRSARTRRIAVGSVLAGTALAVLLWTARVPLQGPYDGVRGLIFLAQIPGMMLLDLNGYGPYMYDGTAIEGLYRPGPVTLLLFSIANALLAVGFVSVARFTWLWIRMPMPRRGPVAEG